MLSYATPNLCGRMNPRGVRNMRLSSCTASCGCWCPAVALPAVAREPQRARHGACVAQIGVEATSTALYARRVGQICPTGHNSQPRCRYGPSLCTVNDFDTTRGLDRRTTPFLREPKAHCRQFPLNPAAGLVALLERSTRPNCGQAGRRSR